MANELDFLEDVLLEYVELYGLTDGARTYFSPDRVKETFDARTRPERSSQQDSART